MEGPRAWDGIQRTGYERRNRREGEGRGPIPRRYIGLAGIALIAVGLPGFIIGYRTWVSCDNLLVFPSCVPFPLIMLVAIVLGVVLVIVSIMLRKA